jgi:diguanylate cyclase (GGDEF)-like protein
MLDLDGFKHYNDTFGHPAGDSLLARLARRLQEITDSSTSAYRIGGDEFCVLAHPLEGSLDEVASKAEAALSEVGDGFSIGSSYGLVLIPTEASEPEEALRVADNRMYAQKRGRPASAGGQSRDVLVQVIAERQPELGRHLSAVVTLAEDTARHLGMPAEELERVRLTAALHDIGKMAIPESILSKPGPLDPDEWEFMKRHCVIGERIVAAAPALAGVSKLVRATHERMDSSGYPDGLSGEEIPLASRVVAVCDSFEAMITGRPYRPPMSVEDALSELRRCAGTKFDPEVVEALIATISEPVPAPAPTPARTPVAVT